MDTNQRKWVWSNHTKLRATSTTASRSGHASLTSCCAKPVTTCSLISTVLHCVTNVNHCAHRSTWPWHQLKLGQRTIITTSKCMDKMMLAIVFCWWRWSLHAYQNHEFRCQRSTTMHKQQDTHGTNITNMQDVANNIILHWH